MHVYMYANNYNTRMLNKLYPRRPFYFSDSSHWNSAICWNPQQWEAYTYNALVLYSQKDGIYVSDYFCYSDITIIIQSFSQWHYSEVTSAPWRLKSPAIMMFVQQLNNKVNGPRYWPL